MTQEYDDDFHEIGHIQFTPVGGNQMEFLPEECDIPDALPLLVRQKNNYEELKALRGIIQTANLEYEKAVDPIAKDTWYKRMNQAAKDLVEATADVIQAERDEWIKKKT